MELSQHPTAKRRRRVSGTVAAAGLATALVLSVGGKPTPEGTCEVPISASLANEGMSGVAGDLDVDVTDITATDANGSPLDGNNREMTIDRSNAFEPDVAVPELSAGDHVTANHVGKAACADLGGAFTPSAPANP